MIDTNEYTACALEALEAGEAEADQVRSDPGSAYRMMADAMPQIVWTALPDGHRDYFNLRWYEHTGLPPTAAEGWSWNAALHAEDQARCAQAWQEAVKGRDAFQIEYRLLCVEDGSYRWHMERALPLFDPANAVVKWFGTCTDIHALKEAQEQIEELNARLHRSMAETHHRVKNSLQLISALVDMQLMSGAETVPAEEFKRMGTHVRTLAAVHDILTREAKEDEPAQQIALQEIVEQLLPVHQQTAPHCLLTARIADIRLTGRKGTSLALVVNELISNAIKHGRGSVEIVVADEGDHVAVSVCDDGPGFPPDFDPKQAANTGLELIDSLVHWDLQGTVTFTNQPQGGGQVTVKIPQAGS